jgi:DNA modification methylase
MPYPNDFVDRIICGDSATVLTEIPDNMIDLVVTSPPYDGLREYHTYIFDFETIAQQLYRVIKPNGVLVWVVGDGTEDGEETGTSFRQALYFKDSVGFNLHDTMIYLKSSFSRPSSNRCHQVFEYMFVLSKGTPKTFHRINDRINIYDRSGRASIRQKDGSLKRSKNSNIRGEFGGRFNVWQYATGHGHSSKDKFAEAHSAIFPEALARDHIYSWSNVGDLVLDPFVGSGTTCKIARLMERHFIGIDISSEYCDIAKRRVAQRSLGSFVKNPNQRSLFS